MSLTPRSPEETYGRALAKARQEFAAVEPAQVAVRAAVSHRFLDDQNAQFHVPFLGTVFQIDWPQATVQCMVDGHNADITMHILLLHYLLVADGTPMGDRWIAFRNLSGGLGYDAAFQRRSSLRLARAFGADKPAFVAAARRLGGEPLAFGDSSYVFRVLPRIWLAVILNLADEEFPAGASILFDAAANHYLPTEDLAVVGGILAGRMLKRPSAGV